MGRRQALVAAGRLAGEVRCVIEEARRGPQTVLDDLLTFPFPSLAAAAAVTVAAVAAAAAAAGGLGDEGITNPSPNPQNVSSGFRIQWCSTTCKTTRNVTQAGAEAQELSTRQAAQQDLLPFPKEKGEGDGNKGGTVDVNQPNYCTHGTCSFPPSDDVIFT